MIHMKPSALGDIKKLNLWWDRSFDGKEIDVIVPDIEYKDGNHPEMNGIWEDPDQQLCDYYNINYDQVNCIELID